MRLIDADALKEEVNKKKVVGRFNTLLLIDNAPTVEPDCLHCKQYQGGYDYGFNLGYNKGKKERPQGEWLFKEIDENYHVYGQCSVCKERNRIGKACRSCGAAMGVTRNEQN